MSYLRIKDLDGTPKRGGVKISDKDLPWIWVSKYGSKRSNSKSPNRNNDWGNRYAQNNSRRQNKASRNG